MESFDSLHGGVGLRLGVYAGWFYEEDHAFSDFLSRFIRESLNRHLSVILFPLKRQSVLCEVLKNTKADFSNQIIQISRDELATSGQARLVEEVLRSIRTARAQANRNGQSGVSVLLDMSVLLEEAGSVFGLGEFSAELERVVAEGDSLILSSYDKGIFSPSEILEAVAFYPQVVIENFVYQNRYFCSAGVDAHQSGHQALSDLLFDRIRGKVNPPDFQWEAVDSGDTLLMLQEIIDSMGDGMMVADENGAMVLFNKAAEGIYGFGRSNLPLAERIRKFGNYLPDRRTPFPIQEMPITRALRGEIVDQVKVFVRNEKRPEGVLISSTARPIHDQRGSIKGAVAVFRDISAQEEALEENARLESRMFQSQKLEELGLLTGGIAHDFNNLLMAVLGNAGLALVECPEGAALRSRIEQIKTGAQRLAELTNQLLVYSGEGSFSEEPVNISELVREMRNLLHTVVSKKAKVVCSAESNLPYMRGDSTQMRQIVMNLITNASDALGKSRGNIYIRTGSIYAEQEYLNNTYLADEMAEGEYVFLEVSDDGCGMDKETMSRIFDPFFTTKVSGRGLGLAAVLGLVRRHGGALRVDSILDGGTTFRVLFPALAEVPVANTRRKEQKKTRKGNGTVLVVDDEEVVRSVTQQILEYAGFSVLTAENGLEGIRVFKKHSRKIDAVLLDMTMPDVNGEQVFRNLKKLRSDVRVILSSGYSKTNKIEGLLKNGLDGYLQKPYVPEKLLDKIIYMTEAS